MGSCEHTCHLPKLRSQLKILSQTLWAAAMLGAVIVAVNCWLSPEGLVHCLTLSDSVVAIVDAERAEQLKSSLPKLKQGKLKAMVVAESSAPSGMHVLSTVLKKYKGAKEIPKVDIQPEDDASIFFTSGTTGFPKAVLSTNRMFMTNIFTLGVANRRMAYRKGEEPPEPSPQDPPRVLLLAVPFFHVTGTILSCLSSWS